MDPKELTLPRRTVIIRRGRAPRHKSGEHFLQGPIPIEWLRQAAHASGGGAGFKVAIALWYLSGLHRHVATVQLTNRTLEIFAVNRYAAYRGLERLEEAGLVSVKRHTGRAPMVTLLDVQVAD